MGALLAFVAGYVMGARAGRETLDEVIDAADAVRRSEEFRELVSAMRTHAAQSLRGLAEVVESGPRSDATASPPAADLLERVRVIVGRR